MDQTPPQFRQPSDAPAPATPARGFGRTHIVLAAVAGFVVGVFLATVVVGPASWFLGRRSAETAEAAPAAAEESSEDMDAGAAETAEISAIARLASEEERARLLNGVATRPELSPEQQVHLVEVAFTGLSSAESKVRVLLLLIENPSFCNAAKEKIASGLENVPSEEQKARLLEALGRRGKLQ